MTNSTNAAEMLEGLTVEGGWRVVRRLTRTPAQTGGNFCVGYEAVGPSGERGFLKALNIGRAMTTPDPVRMLQSLTAGFNFERDLLRKCGRTGMSRVVVSVTDGVVDVADSLPSRVNYIIFEWADGGDIRMLLDEMEAIDDAIALRSLHHMATGLKQLHSNHIAHQDLKPSNVLNFRGSEGATTSKLGDLGRSTDQSTPAEHDAYEIAGDPSYAPPEQLYGATPQDFGPRRLGCDLYQLGSMITFVFAGGTFNAFLYSQVPGWLHPGNWAGTYSEALPYIRDAFGHAVNEISEAIPGGPDGALLGMIRYLCDPDPDLRGHPVTRRRPGSPFDLTRVVTDLDVMVRKAELNLQGRSVA